MSKKYTGTFEQLKAQLKSIGTEWDESQTNKKVLRRDGAVLSWFVSTGSLQFQGKAGAKERLEADTLKILYPDQPETAASISTQETLIAAAVLQEPPPAEASLETQYLLHGVNNSELIIGLVSAVGTESKLVTDPLKDRLKGFGYSTEEIRLSQILPPDTSGGLEYDRIRHYMSAGDAHRERAGNNAILAAGAAKLIAEKRTSNSTNLKKAYIINSLKHPDEVAFLRKVYGDGFYLFGIHADVKRRHHFLTEDKGCTSTDADLLIKIDEDESIDHGQKTRDTFHLSDFFLNLGKNSDQVKNTIQRFLELIFSHPYQNPTFDEFSMFMAFNSSVRSSDLSRQVGSVISKHQQIIATGANDVPRSGGGLYWAEIDPDTGKVKDQADGKDYTREEDSNKRTQIEIIDEITASALREGLVIGDQSDKLKELLKQSKISDLTEFGRVVHAEMEALLSCGRAGIPTAGAILYCTTFPCHNCAKHIIAAGIERVVYVEPYPKSRALDFHSESIQLKTQPEEKHDPSLVTFEPFIGVGPRRFLDLFSMNLGSGSKLKRKSKQGGTLEWSKETAVIRTPLLPHSYLDIEKAAIALWTNSIK
ncbi:UNVERIFIED_ORG: deoxycytidylate deaminase [Zoogloea ramigera]|uniref:Anti-phage dCTP deaminase n=1 Tax=Duganella zoogloeoides TaxID=75659 RepID=A0ABZ0XU93_9BURK|nr:anti-phage dCTP deaminase [Duganella zoogloeoides]WQH03128.1 anti-phage dCTP deaminase [Duganella zoogloeoides]